MNYAKLIGGGFGIYAVIFVLWSIFVAYGFSEGIVPQIISVIVAFIVTYFAGKIVNAHSAREMLKYSFGWLVIVALLDVVASVPFTGWELFLDWNIWVGYAIVLFVPLLTMNKPAEIPQQNA